MSNLSSIHLLLFRLIISIVVDILITTSRFHKNQEAGDPNPEVVHN